MTQTSFSDSGKRLPGTSVPRSPRMGKPSNLQSHGPVDSRCSTNWISSPITSLGPCGYPVTVLLLLLGHAETGYAAVVILFANNDPFKIRLLS